VICVPAWVVRESAEGYLARLGSEPRKDSEPLLVPREVVTSCVYVPGELPGTEPRFAMLVLARIPESLKSVFSAA